MNQIGIYVIFNIIIILFFLAKNKHFAIWIYVHTYIHTYMRSTLRDIYIHTHIYTHERTHTHTHIHTYTRTHTHTHTHTYTCTHTYTHNIYIYIYIYLEVNNGKESDSMQKTETKHNPNMMNLYNGKSTLTPFGFMKPSSGSKDGEKNVARTTMEFLIN